MVDMVATTPSREVAIPMAVASGAGSCLGTIIAFFSAKSREPP